MPKGSELEPQDNNALEELRRLQQQMVEEGAISLRPKDGVLESFIKNTPDHKLNSLLPSFCRRYVLKYPGGDLRQWMTEEAKRIDKRERETEKIEVTVPEPTPPLPPEEEERLLLEMEERHAKQQAFSLAHSNDETTDYGNADRFINLYGLDVKYIAPFDAWYVWNKNEGRWKRDGKGEIQECAKKTILSIYKEAERHGFGSDHGKRLAKWALECQNTAHTSAILKLACSDPWIVTPPETFDKDAMLINMANGVFNLTTYRLLEHSKERLISQTTGVVYDPTATCPLWESFLKRIFKTNKNRDEIISFIQRAIGYSLTALTHEQVLFLLYGKGQNGKSVLLGTIDRLMGEYGYTADSSSFTTAKSDKVRNDIAAWVGKRFVQSSEITKTAILDEALIKHLTGGEKVTTRFLYQEEFTFIPVMKLWLAFNHRPDIRDRTYSIWRRILLIPFEEVIPEDEQDKRLQEKLISELPGIFNWAVAGLKDYVENGLNPPECVKVATQEYRHDTDVLYDFINEICVTDNPNNRELSSELYNAYRQWCAFNHELEKNMMSSSKFGREMGERFRKERTTKGVYYWGVGLNQTMYAKVTQERKEAKYDTD